MSRRKKFIRDWLLTAVALFVAIKLGEFIVRRLL